MTMNAHRLDLVNLSLIMLALLPAAVPAQTRPLPPVPVPRLSAPAEGSEVRATALVSTATPRPRAGSHDCVVEPSMVVSVGSPVDGVLQEVLADRGDTVRKGQRVAQLQAGVEAAAVDLSNARVLYGRRKVERNESLFQKQLISAQEKDEMETEVSVHEEELKRDRENLKLRLIVSPLNGVVIERKLNEGDLVRADKSIVMKLAQLDPLYVEVVVPAEEFGSVKVGMTGRVGMAPFAAGNHLARVTVVDRMIDAASGTFGVRLQLENPSNRFPAGVRCRVRFGP